MLVVADRAQSDNLSHVLSSLKSLRTSMLNTEHYGASVSEPDPESTVLSVCVHSPVGRYARAEDVHIQCHRRLRV